MPRYTVTLWTPHAVWDNVEAENEQEAKNKCATDHFDFNQPNMMTADAYEYEENEDEK